MSKTWGMMEALSGDVEDFLCMWKFWGVVIYQCDLGVGPNASKKDEAAQVGVCT